MSNIMNDTMFKPTCRIETALDQSSSTADQIMRRSCDWVAEHENFLLANGALPNKADQVKLIIAHATISMEDFKNCCKMWTDIEVAELNNNLNER